MKGKHRAEAQPPNDDMQAQDSGQEAVDKDLQDLMTAVQRASDERDQLQDQLLRTMADFQNFRKRQEDQRKQLEQFATERLVRALLPVMDTFERAIASSDTATVESLVEGLRAIDRQLRQVLEGQNLTRIPSVGQQFDPEVHEALAMEPTEEYEDNSIIQELEAGYRMGDRVIRPARVRVARKP